MEEEVERRLNTAMIDIMENKVLGPAIRKGLEQGREEGREEGRALGRLELLRDLLEDRFGKLPAWAEAKIASAAPDTLKAWSLQVHRVDSLADLLT